VHFGRIGSSYIISPNTPICIYTKKNFIYPVDGVELIENTDIVRFIKSRRIAWLGHVMRMYEKRKPKKSIRVETNRQENQRKNKEKMD